jgi:hypothetical protein
MIRKLHLTRQLFSLPQQPHGPSFLSLFAAMNDALSDVVALALFTD